MSPRPCPPPESPRLPDRAPVRRPHQPHGPRRAAWLGLLASVVLVAACGGGGGSTDPVTPPPSGPAGTLALARSGDVVAQAQRTLRARSSTAGAGSLLGLAGARLLDGAVASVGAAAAALAAATPTAAGGQLLLETGVDEADLLKADAAGRLLWSIDSATGHQPVVQAQQRASDGALGAATRMAMVADGTAWMAAEGLLLAPDAQAAAAIATGWIGLPFDQLCKGEVCLTAGSSGGAAATMIAPGWMAPRVLVQRFELAAGTGSGPVSRLAIEGELVDQRQVGQQLVLVTRHRPVLAIDLLPAGASAAQREAAIAGLDAATLLPRVRVDGGADQPLVQETDCWLQADNASPLVEFTTVTLIDLGRPGLPRTSRCFAGGTEALHLGGNRLLLAQTNVAYTVSAQGTVYTDQTRTQLHLFTLESGSLAWRASGEVPGHLGWDRSQSPYRLSVHEGDVRVLSFTGATGWGAAATAAAPSPATLTILRESASQPGRLEVLASLPNAQRPQPIGKAGEQLYAVRFVGDRAYAVTFRRIDPLYVIDLADPRDPRVAGELELPGFSQHLLPLPNGLLLGVGQDADTSGQTLTSGVQLTLFDVADASQPRLLARQTLGRAGSQSVLDLGRQGMSLVLRDQTVRLALPVALTGSDWTQRTSSLQTATVDTQARTLTLGAALGASTDDAQADLWRQRSLQLGDQLYWLRTGTVGVFGWPGG